MDNYIVTYAMIPILNIVKGNLVQHANEQLTSDIINELSRNITEAVESFVKDMIDNKIEVR